MEKKSPKRNRLTPWYIGVVVVFASVIYIGHKMWTGNCPEPGMLGFVVLIIIPTVYLALMYLTFISQE